MSESATLQVVDEPDKHRFVVHKDGHEAELVYRVEPERLVLVHTGVPDELGGHGIGGLLVRAGIERALEQARVVVPQCSFARKWLQDHPDVANQVTIDWG